MPVPPMSSGVLGRAGRLGAPDPGAPTALTLGGRVLPMVGPARIYVCGITPYDVTHLGHAATFVWADVVASVLRSIGVDVVTCRNITDVDDVLTRAAEERGRHYDEFASSQEFLFSHDMQALRVRRPAFEPRARHHVGDVVALASALLAAGAAYVREGHVFFRGQAAVVAAADRGIDRDQARELSAEYGDTPGDPLREDPFDVPVWRPSADTDPAWPSPWGWGRPGWHAECAAMALAVLGAGVDVLAGGADLTFPHHAYQAAMVEAACGVGPFGRARLGVGTVLQDGVKMAKSVGNLTLVGTLLERAPAAAVRLLLLDRPWASSWTYDPTELDAAAGRLEALYAAAGRPGATDSAITRVDAALLDDLDVVTAVAVAEEAGGGAARHALAVLDLA